MVETKRQEPRLAAAGDEKRFLGDLEKYCRIVTELGGVDVRVVTPQDIVQNIRPRLRVAVYHNVFRLSRLTMSIITITPKLRAAASAIMRAGISKTPWGSIPEIRKPSDFSLTTDTETKPRSQPLTNSAISGNRQRIGLRTKLITSAKILLARMNITVRN